MIQVPCPQGDIYHDHILFTMSWGTLTMSSDTCHVFYHVPGSYSMFMDTVIMFWEHFPYQGCLVSGLFSSAMISNIFTIVRCRTFCAMYMDTLGIFIDTFNMYANVLLYLLRIWSFCIYLEAYIYIYMCVWRHIYICVCVCVCVCVYIYIYIYNRYHCHNAAAWFSDPEYMGKDIKIKLYVTCGHRYDNKY
jgi:hypothetical protein